MAPQGFKYSALAEDDDVQQGLLEDEKGTAATTLTNAPGSTTKSWSDWIIRLSICVVIGCTVFDAICFLYLVGSTRGRSEGPTTAFDDLPIRSTYIGLEKLYSKKGTKSSKLSPISNLPHFVGHVDSASPDQPTPLWTKMWASQDGMVPYDERRTMVTPTISTIAQFHVIDFGMEHCSPRLSIPARGSDAGEEPDYQVDVWALEQEKLLHTEDLSWNTKPRRRKFLGTFSGASNSTQSLPGFNCKSGTYQTFELTCRTGDCNLHVHTTGRKIRGFYLIQHQTV